MLFNAVPCGVGAEGDTWFYSQPHAVAEVAAETNPWVYSFEYGQLMLLEWFPSRRHHWFDVPCCPPNLGRLFASVDRHVAEVDASGDLLVHLPVAARVQGEGWDVQIDSDYPQGGTVEVRVAAAPPGATVRVRVPGWAGGDGHVALPPGGRTELPVEWQWWETDGRVEGATGTVYLRRGPVVHCVEGVDAPGVDLRDVVVDPRLPPDEAFAVVPRGEGRVLHRPFAGGTGTEPAALRATTVAYAEWANRGMTTMRLRFPVR